MIVTVVPIIEPDLRPGAPLAQVMNERLSRLARELRDEHLKSIEFIEPAFEDVVIYISYNNNYNIRWKIVNDVSEVVVTAVTKACDQLGYIKWKTISENISQRD